MLLFFVCRFYSSPYSIPTNRMIPQTSITPFIAASPVSTYQVRQICACLLCFPVNYVLDVDEGRVDTTENYMSTCALESCYKQKAFLKYSGIVLCRVLSVSCILNTSNESYCNFFLFRSASPSNSILLNFHSTIADACHSY